VVCAFGNRCQFSREGVGNWLQPRFACLAAKGGIWQGRVAVLAVVLVVAFLSSHCEATTSLGLPIWKVHRTLGPRWNGVGDVNRFRVHRKARSRGFAHRAGGRAREDLLAFAVGVELEVFHTLLADDVTSIVGLKGRHPP
jgi:hypothetical protein